MRQKNIGGRPLPGGGRHGVPIYVSLAVAAIATVLTWSYFSGQEARRKPVTVVLLDREKTSAPAVPVREVGPPPSQSTAEKKEPAPSLSGRPESGPEQPAGVKEVSEPKIAAPETLKAAPSEGTSAGEKVHELLKGRMPFVLHVGSYQSEGVAGKEAHKLKEKGYPAFAAAYDISGKGRWYRVYSGRYGSTAEAEASGIALKRSNLVQYASPMKLPYSLQLGVYDTREEAIREEEKLNLLGYRPTILEAEGKDRRVYYFLLVGAYESVNAAAETASRLKDDGYKTVVATP